MIRSYQLTSADSAAHVLYKLILAAEGVTLPQRVDLGDVIFPNFVASITFSLPLSQTGNSGQSLSVQDQTGNEITSVLAGIPFTIGPLNINSIDLNSIKLQATASGVVTDVAVNQV